MGDSGMSEPQAEATGVEVIAIQGGITCRAMDRAKQLRCPCQVPDRLMGLCTVPPIEVFTKALLDLDARIQQP
jgi:hypothetical protein